MERRYLLITEKFLFWTFRWWEIWPFFESRSWWKRWYLLITEKFLFWTFRWWEIRSFFESRSWLKDDIYWLLGSSYFELFVDGKYSLVWVKKLMGRWYLLVTEKFLFWTFRWWEIRYCLSQEVDGKDDIYWLIKSSCFELFGGGKYGLFESRSWWKDDNYWLPRSSCFELFNGGKCDLFSVKKLVENLVFLSFPWYFRTSEIQGFLCSETQ